MEIASKIEFKVKTKKNKAVRVQANFKSDDVADMILISGTEDIKRIRKNKRVWTSRCKYTSLALSLQYIKDGNLIETVSYDSTGAKINPVSAKVVLTDLTYEVDNSTATLNWKSIQETNLKEYQIYRALNNSIEEESIGGTAPQGINTPYSFKDEVGRGIYDYKCYAIFNNTIEGDKGELGGVWEDVEVL